MWVTIFYNFPKVEHPQNVICSTVEETGYIQLGEETIQFFPGYQRIKTYSVESKGEELELSEETMRRCKFQSNETKKISL